RPTRATGTSSALRGVEEVPMRRPLRRWSVCAVCVGALVVRPVWGAPPASAIKVCVEVVPKSWSTSNGAAPAPEPLPPPLPLIKKPAPPTPSGPESVRPELYLRRLLEYEVTHDEWYEAVDQGCQEHMIVELYDLSDGWTVFGRFSRFAREEKVDHVRL